MAERIRVKCPICGMRPNLEDLLKIADTDPKELHVYLQKFGGKVAMTATYSEKPVKKGGAPGYMEYQEITDSLDPATIQQIRDYFDKRVQGYLEE